MTTIQERLNRRLLAPAAFLLILLISGLASMAALSTTLTVSADLNKAQAELSGNNIPTAVTLFQSPNDVLVPNGASVGTPVFDGLVVKNTGNVAMSVIGAAPTIGGTLGTDVEFTAARNPTANDETLVCDSAAFTAAGAGQNGWTSITGTYDQWPATPPVNLGAGEVQQYCFGARLIANSANTGNVSVTQVFTGTTP